MRHYTLYILSLLLLFSSTLCGETRAYDTLQDTLSILLAERAPSFERQLERINNEEKILLNSIDKRERFETYYTIFNLSRSYKYDIAFKYANEALTIAKEIGDIDLINRAKACLISTLTSGGLFSEAADVVNSVNTVGVSDAVKRELYYNIIRYYSDQLDYASQTTYKQRYKRELLAYADSLIALSPTKDYYYTYAKAYQALTSSEPQQAIEVLEAFYSSTDCSEHHASIITFLLGLSYFELGDDTKGFEYLTKSMSHDIKAAARENRSIKTLSEKLHERGEQQMAEQLIHVALADATFYNARHRNLEINTLLPIINQQRIATIRHQRNMLYGFLAVVMVLSIVAVVFGVMARRNARKIAHSKRIIQQQLQAITDANKELQESNSIKEHYIIESLYKKSEHIKQLESLLKKIDVKVKSHLYDDLKYLHKDFNIKQERENFFSDFDGAFLRLFTNFIEEYNQLFNPEDWIKVDESTSLPPEVRIFALMRLGVTDNERISKFLDLSINTIYTYKTKVKNRSIVPKEAFESRILGIQLTSPA